MRTISRLRRFSTSQSSGGSAANTASSPTQMIRSGGKSSYIGFGRFEGMTREGGSVQKGLEYLKDALKAHESVVLNPVQKREQARYHHDIAMCHHRGGDVDGAIMEYSTTVSLLEALLLATPGDPTSAALIKRSRFDLSSAFSGLSVAYADKGSDTEALEYALKALELRKGLMGPNHASVAECLNNLGGLYFRQANYSKAADVYQESLRILLNKTAGKEENKYVALAYYNIGLTYDKLGIKKGADAIQKALLIAQHVWGPDHDQTVLMEQTLSQMRGNESSRTS